MVTTMVGRMVSNRIEVTGCMESIDTIQPMDIGNMEVCMLNRRNFLKVSVAVATVPSFFDGLKNKWRFDPNATYGQWIAVDRELSAEGRMQAWNAILKSARSVLPPGTRFEVIIQNPSDEMTTIAWKYTKYRKAKTNGFEIIA